MAVLSCAEMKALEEEAFARGVSAEDLMEQAGRGIAEVILKKSGKKGLAVAFIGKGNNGGDALVALRYLRKAGWEVRVKGCCPAEDLSPLAKKNLQRLGVELIEKESPKDRRIPEIVLDGLLGIGAQGPLREPLLGLAKEMGELREQGSQVLAIDIPSGLDGDKGTPRKGAVVADVTVTIACPKQGLLADESTDWVGALEVVKLPELTPDKTENETIVVTREHLQGFLKRKPFSLHKGEAGRVQIVAGSQGLLGAAALAAKGALRGGAGLVTLMVKEEIYPLIVPLVPVEVMTHPFRKWEDLLEQEAESLVIGPGLGKIQEEDAFLQFLKTASARKRTVIDADALNFLAKKGVSELQGNNCLWTPHPGEMERLFPKSKNLNRSETAQAFVNQNGGTLLYKGARTLITAKDKGLHYNSTGTPAMASGGQGDVLSGLLGALLARGKGTELTPLQAAITGAWLAGRASQIALEKGSESEESLSASTTADFLGKAFREIKLGQKPSPLLE